MIKFLLKGIWRDSTRSKFPIIIVVIGVIFTVTMTALLTGVFRDIIDINARFSTGHVKVSTLGYSEYASQNPMDMALLDVDSLIVTLSKDYPDMEWVPRINFGGLMDLSDENGETRGQGTAIGQAYDFFSKNSKEVKRLNLETALREGHLPTKSGEALVSQKFAEKARLKVGDEITFFGSTMYGSMSFQNFTVSGLISFGNPGLDRSGFIIDISDARQMLDMEGGSTELLGYFKDDKYNDDRAMAMKSNFNKTATDSTDEFSSVMLTLKDQKDLRSLIDYADNMQQIMVVVFVLAMSIVLWNVGLLGGLRRYKEFGVRLALGESKGGIFKKLLIEASLIGAIGSVIGTLIALAIVYPLQKYGFDISEMLPDTSMMIPSVYRAIITPATFYLGFIPGILAMVLGQALSGIGIYRRETAKLFKELEV